MSIYYVKNLSDCTPNNIVLYNLEQKTKEEVLDILLVVSAILNTKCVKAFCPIGGSLQFQLCYGKYYVFQE